MLKSEGSALNKHGKSVVLNSQIQAGHAHKPIKETKLEEI
jgi:hypothetical protein